MLRGSGSTESVWMSVSPPVFSPLHENARADVCIVGAGIAGLTTAYLLTREGKSVIVLDDGPILSGETSRTTAHLSFALDDRYSEIERLHGAKGARLAAESHMAAVDKIESIVAAEQIDCDFRRLDGYLFLGPGDSPDILTRELDAAYRAGLTDVRLLPRLPLSFHDFGSCLVFPRQGQFHPVKYLAALASRIQQSNGRIYTDTHVIAVEGGTPARVSTEDGLAVRADAVVVATNTPINDHFAIHTKQAPYRTYVIGMSVPKDSVPLGLYWDTPDPYHYVRLATSDDDRDILIVGGEDHKTGQATDYIERFDRLAAWTRGHFPMVQDVVYRWSGQVMEPVDYLAFIGRNPMDKPNVMIATGDSGHGMTHGTIAGMLLTDLIMERDNPWTDLYDPRRKTLRSAMEFARENLNVAAQYTEWLTAGEVDSVDKIPSGWGAILRRGATKIAVYRDEAGNLHEFSAECTHLGCVVSWNRLEHTWDCPCHGSRFDVEGRVVSGPAHEALHPAEAQEPAHA